MTEHQMKTLAIHLAYVYQENHKNWRDIFPNFKEYAAFQIGLDIPRYAPENMREFTKAVMAQILISEPLSVEVDSGILRVTLKGVLNDSEHCKKECAKLANYKDLVLIVEASDAYCAVGGMQTWLDAVAHLKDHCIIKYNESQLAHGLYYYFDNPGEHGVFLRSWHWAEGKFKPDPGQE